VTTWRLQSYFVISHAHDLMLNQRDASYYHISYIISKFHSHPKAIPNTFININVINHHIPMPPIGSFDNTTTDSRDRDSPKGPMPTSSSSLELKLYRQQSSFRFTECQGWLTRAWALHFAACILAISIGSLTNHGER
jgi:hypothetical protein